MYSILSSICVPLFMKKKREKMPLPLLVPLAMMAASAIAGGISNKIANDRQRKMQRQLQKDQVAEQQKMNVFNQKLGMKQWDETNYSAQTEQMRKAGLNIGMMYGGTGGTGGQAGSFGGQIGMGQAPDQGKGTRELMGMGSQAAMQMMLMKAQKDNIDADTKLIS